MKVLFEKKIQRFGLLKDQVLQRSAVSALAVLFFIFFSLPVLAQNTIRVKGRITNETGQPVASASVVVKGTSNGVTADENGNYEITAPSNGVLVFSAVNFIPQEMRISNRTSLMINLVAADKNLGEVVVVGYGTQKRKDVTGSIVSLSETTLREVPVANLQQALQGRAAGVEVQRTGTKPGDGTQIRIRGIRSILGSNDPLFVVDGIPFEGSLNDLNPDDVATIDILKDASATAIYGSRGANGVIIVTTKKGRGGDTRVSYNGYYGFSKVADKYPVYNAQEYQAMRNTSTWGAGYQAEELKGITLGRNTDWQDLMYDNAYRTDHNLTVAGGSNGSTFSLGGGYYKETAVLPGQDFTRYSLRAAIDSRIGSKIKVGISTLNQVSVTSGSQFVAGATMFPVLALSPLMAPYDSAGNVVYRPNGNVDDNNSPQYSPLLLKYNNNNWVDRVRRLTTNNSVYGELEIIKGLRYRINVGLSYRQAESDQFQSGNTATNPAYFRGLRGNTANVNNAEAWGYTIENLLYYDKTIAKKHRIGFTALYSTQENHSHNTQVAKDSITEDFVQFYNLAQSSPTPVPTVTGNESSWALLSYMGRVNYAYDDKYLLTLTARADGSSRLATGHKWHYYPAVSVGWNITNESFIGHIKNLNSLKLRAGYGQTSNQAIDPYAALGLVSNSNGLAAPGNIIRYNYGPTIVTGYNVINLANKTLDWEYTKVLNIGLDFGLFSNRLTGSVEYYSSRTVKLLNAVTLPPTSGVAGQLQANVGEMQNKGVEITLSSINVRTHSGFTWSTDFNLFFNKNKLIKMANGQTEDVANQLFQGYSMTAIYDYNKIGIWQASEATQAATFGSLPGQIKLEDHSGPNGKPDGVISALYDRYVIGDMDADLQGGMTNRFSFKGFDLSTVMYARFGGLLVSQLHQPIAAYLTVMDGRRNGIAVDYWTPTNPSNWFPMPQATISPISTAWTTLGYYKASFVKIRSINLGYTFATSVLKKISAQSIRVYATVDNVGILFSPFYKQTGVDPEGTGLGNQGVSNPGNIRNNNRGNGALTLSASTPPTRSFTIGANLTF
jgi:TonB-linked SusC/RagA family outer membrane protein